MEFDLKQHRPALLILDLQELFCSAEGPFENTGADTLIDEANYFAAECAALGLPVIYSRYLFRDDLSDAGLLADNPVVQAGHFCESSQWMKLDRRLRQTPGCIDLQRSRPGAFWNGGLEQTLAANNCDALLLAGLSVNNAISTTAREAFARDIPAIVIRECSGAAPWESDIDSHFATLHTWTAEVTSMQDCQQRLGVSTN